MCSLCSCSALVPAGQGAIVRCVRLWWQSGRAAPWKGLLQQEVLAHGRRRQAAARGRVRAALYKHHQHRSHTWVLGPALWKLPSWRSRLRWEGLLPAKEGHCVVGMTLLPLSTSFAPQEMSTLRLWARVKITLCMGADSPEWAWKLQLRWRVGSAGRGEERAPCLGSGGASWQFSCVKDWQTTSRPTSLLASSRSTALWPGQGPW